MRSIWKLCILLLQVFYKFNANSKFKKSFKVGEPHGCDDVLNVG